MLFSTCDTYYRIEKKNKMNWSKDIELFIELLYFGRLWYFMKLFMYASLMNMIYYTMLMLFVHIEERLIYVYVCINCISYVLKHCDVIISCKLHMTLS